MTNIIKFPDRRYEQRKECRNIIANLVNILGCAEEIDAAKKKFNDKLALMGVVLVERMDVNLRSKRDDNI